MDTASIFSVSHVIGRFLLPFRFDPDRYHDICKILSLSTTGETHKWEAKEPGGSYTSEYLPDFVTAYFGPSGGYSYFRLSAQLSRDWFGAECDLWYPGRERGPQISHLSKTSNGGGVELFLFPMGAGALSVSLGTTAEENSAEPLSLAAVRTFTYRLSQHLPFKAALIKKRLSSLSGSENCDEQAQETARKTSPFDASLPALLSSGRHWIPLKTLCRFLLLPLQEREPACIQFLQPKGLLLPYNVVRFSSRISFSTVALPTGLSREEDLAGFASALSQVEEASHPYPAVDSVAVPACVLATDVMAAASSMGAAFLVADVGSRFDEDKLAVYRDKYFVGYLTALLQRLVLQQFAGAAAPLAHSPEPARSEGLAKLRNRMLDFRARGHFVEIASRDILNRYFSLSQQAHRVPESLALVQEAIADLDSALQSEHQNDSLRVLAATQRKIEWIEVFLISFYATELAELLGKGFDFSHRFLSVATCGVLLSAVLIAAFLIRPWQHPPGASHQSQEKVKFSWPPRAFWYHFLLLLGVLGLFLFAGFQSREHHEDARQSEQVTRLAKELAAAAKQPEADVPALSNRLGRAQAWLTAARALPLAEQQEPIEAARDELTEVRRLAQEIRTAKKSHQELLAVCSPLCGNSQSRTLAASGDAAWLAGDYPLAERFWSSARALQKR